MVREASIATICVRAKMLLLCSLRGSIIIYQGEELGLPQVDVPFDRLQDPEAIANWPRNAEPRRREDADAVEFGRAQPRLFDK